MTGYYFTALGIVDTKNGVTFKTREYSVQVMMSDSSDSESGCNYPRGYFYSYHGYVERC